MYYMKNQDTTIEIYVTCKTLEKKYKSLNRSVPSVRANVEYYPTFITTNADCLNFNLT